MDFPGSPDIDRMAAENDYEGLYRCLEHKDSLVRLRAAQVLADLNDGTGWRHLVDALRPENDTQTRITAAAMLGELGHPRAVAPLRDMLMKMRMVPAADPVAAALRDALEAIGTPDAEDALRDSGYEPVLPVQHHTVIEYSDHYVRPIRPQTGDIRFLTAEEHLNNAVDLRESEHTERGLVEISLALWLRPDWGYAWYLRGVLFEDIEREYEAVLAYRHALELEPSLHEAREALDELENKDAHPDAAMLLADLTSRDWRRRRDAAAAFADLSSRGETVDPAAVDALLTCLDDEDREVRHAAVEALGCLGDLRALPPLLNLTESSWLVRFAVIQALSGLRSVEGLYKTLTGEMERIQELNPIFSAQKDPMIEVEYESLMEIGARAFERTGDIAALLDLAEGNQWEMVEEIDLEHDDSDNEPFDLPMTGAHADEDEFDDEEEPDADLMDYVDETAQMAVTALQRLALPALDRLDRALLERLAAVPDLTLLDLTSEEAEPVVVVDLNRLRLAAQAALVQRGQQT